MKVLFRLVAEKMQRRGMKILGGGDRYLHRDAEWTGGKVCRITRLMVNYKRRLGAKSFTEWAFVSLWTFDDQWSSTKSCQDQFCAIQEGGNMPKARDL